MHKDEVRLREAGERLTPQRRLILEIMQESYGHISAETVVERAQSKDESINIATVYRVLSWLTAHEIICVTDMGEKDLSYEYLGNPRHHHLICQECNSQFDVPFSLLDPVKKVLQEQYNFTARMDHQAIFGVCGKCQEAAAY